MAYRKIKRQLGRIAYAAGKFTGEVARDVHTVVKNTYLRERKEVDRNRRIGDPFGLKLHTYGKTHIPKVNVGKIKVKKWI